MKNIIKKSIICGIALYSLITTSSCKNDDTEFSPTSPVSIDIWNYYNGDQKTSFDDLIYEFNNTVGLENGIIVNSISQSDISTLADELIDSVNEKNDSQKTPNIAAIYPETVYILDSKGKVAELNSYFSDDELSQYVPGFIEEGKVVPNGPLLSFPVSKSTEIFICNKTDWNEFEQSTGITLESAMSMEGMAKAAEKYYLWTDNQTPDTREDGKSLYGRDSLSNYIYIGCEQLGNSIYTINEDGDVQINLDYDTFKTLWDNYYIPYINGYYGSYCPYRSDDAKTGKILAMTGSSSSITYFPTSVTSEDDSTYDIEVVVDKPLMFENRVKNVAVQQGASFCVIKTNSKEEKASVEFLKWFTEKEINTEFSLRSGYLPVKKISNDSKIIENNINIIHDNAKSINILNSLLISSDIINTWDIYSSRPFPNSKELRNYLESSFSDICKNDRAEVVEKIRTGMTRQEAVSQYITQEYFESWFYDLKSEAEYIVLK